MPASSITAVSSQPDSLSGLRLSSVLVCHLMNMMVGVNVLAISYTAPVISKQWGVGADDLGIVFGAGLLGMTLGAMLLAPWADRMGRRAMLLLAAGLIGTSMIATAYVSNLPILGLARLLTGVGIGATLASAATLTSEYAPARTKDFWVSFVMAGYPLGAVLSGLVAAWLIPAYGWPAMFLAAGALTLLTLAIILMGMAESLDFLLQAQPVNALSRSNRILSRMQRPTLTALPIQSADNVKPSVSSLLTTGWRTSTLRLWLTFALAFTTLYFLTSWIPKLAATTGLPLELAIYAGTVFNLGAFIGIVTQGYLSARLGLLRVIGGFLVLTAGLMIGFSQVSPNSVGVLVSFGLIGFAMQGGAIGLYAAAARLYPTEIRSTGVGWAIGMGRVGAIVGSLIGGWLISAGLSMSLNFIFFALPVFVAGLLALTKRTHDNRTDLGSGSSGPRGNADPQA